MKNLEERFINLCKKLICKGRKCFMFCFYFLNRQGVHRIDGWAHLIEHRQAWFFRNRHLLHHVGNMFVLLLLMLLMIIERLWLDELGWRWWWDWRHVEDWAVRWTKSVREDSRGTRLVDKEAPVSALILSMSHCRWDRADWWCFAVGTGRHAHCLHAILLLLL